MQMVHGYIIVHKVRDMGGRLVCTILGLVWAARRQGLGVLESGIHHIYTIYPHMIQ